MHHLTARLSAGSSGAWYLACAGMRALTCRCNAATNRTEYIPTLYLGRRILHACRNRMQIDAGSGDIQVTAPVATRRCGSEQDRNSPDAPDRYVRGPRATHDERGPHAIADAKQRPVSVIALSARRSIRRSTFASTHGRAARSIWISVSAPLGYPWECGHGCARADATKPRQRAIWT